MEPECIFCRIATKKMSAQLVYEDSTLVAFRDVNPQAPVHILLVPKKHIATISESNEVDSPLFGQLVWAAKQLAEKEGISKDGFRLVMNQGMNGGQTVFHLHLHLLGGRSFSWPPG